MGHGPRGKVQTSPPRTKGGVTGCGDGTRHSGRRGPSPTWTGAGTDRGTSSASSSSTCSSYCTSRKSPGRGGAPSGGGSIPETTRPQILGTTPRTAPTVSLGKLPERSGDPHTDPSGTGVKDRCKEGPAFPSSPGRVGFGQRRGCEGNPSPTHRPPRTPVTTTGDLKRGQHPSHQDLGSVLGLPVPTRRGPGGGRAGTSG